MVDTEKILIAGCGYVGSALAAGLIEAGHTVFALSRKRRALAGATPVCADLLDPETLTALPPGIDVVFYTAAASGAYDERSYRRIYVDGMSNLLEALASRSSKCRRVLFTSSTGVYGQNEGEEVDERSTTAPGSFSGKIMLEAEARLRSSAFPCTILRLGGIYGPGRNRLIDTVARGDAQQAEATFTNRIHRDDAAGILAHLMALDQPEPIYLGVDCAPAKKIDVLGFIADTLGVPRPAPADAAPSTRGGNKRCSNRLLLRSGYRFTYPTFAEGYAEMIGDYDKLKINP